ncbi:cell division protein FtsQ/DivIB [Thiohalorhabdus sp.]|uniref:cell division protein FtsQ/DivIB n=1 Tax=Thiohalorhabdus sp. TaxID=3094134 RepID=UPI002FC2D99B
MARQRRPEGKKPSRLHLPVRLRYLVVAGLVVAAGVAVAGQMDALRTWLDRQFPVTGMAVAMELRHEDPDALAHWLAERLRGGFFTADLGRLQGALEERPWVREARLRRRWPGKLVVAITEHRPVARWRPGPRAGWRLVNAQGAVFRPEDPAVGGLPRLEGPRARLEELRSRLAVLKGRLGQGPRVSGLRVDARGDWTAHLGEGITVRFGRDSWSRRLERLMRVSRGWGLLERTVTRIDLRYPDGIAVAVAEGARSGLQKGEQASTGGLPPAARLVNGASSQPAGLKGRI